MRTYFYLAVSTLCFALAECKIETVERKPNQVRSPSRDKHVIRDNQGPKPDVFWGYYDSKGSTVERVGTEQGSYERHSPEPWHGLPMTRHVDSREVLELGRWTSLSQGPRRRKKRSLKAKTIKDIKEFLHIPLFCWKMIVNCRIFPRHVCCPVMPSLGKKGAKRRTRKKKRRKQKMSSARAIADERTVLSRRLRRTMQLLKRKINSVNKATSVIPTEQRKSINRSKIKEGLKQKLEAVAGKIAKLGRPFLLKSGKKYGQRRKRSVPQYYDPLFGIPIQVFDVKENLARSEDISKLDETPYLPQLKKPWVPYTPSQLTGISLPPSAAKRCYMDPDDCAIMVPDHPCCSYLKRTFSVSPMVQPSLLENWVKTLFP